MHVCNVQYFGEGGGSENSGHKFIPDYLSHFVPGWGCIVECLACPNRNPPPILLVAACQLYSLYCGVRSQEH